MNNYYSGPTQFSQIIYFLMNPYFVSEEQQSLSSRQLNYPSFNDDAEYQKIKQNRLTYIMGDSQITPEYQEKSYFQKQNYQTPLEPAKLTENGDNLISGQTLKDKDQIKQVIHRIHPNDTLEGLSLIYDVPISRIQQRNELSSSEIYYLKTVIIPNPKYIPELDEKNIQEIKIKDMMGYLERGDRSEKTARFYLSENQWDIEKAVKQYFADLQWERNHKKQAFEMNFRGKNGERNFTHRHQHERKKLPRNQFYEEVEMVQFNQSYQKNPKY